jgi:uncharacterized membrane protein HdeD (DUF308 family)
MTASATSMETRQRPWWITLILGIAALIIGAILLWGAPQQKADTYMLLVSLIGIYWLIYGIMELVGMFIDHTAWAWKLFIGIISIAAGGYVLAYPVAAAIALPRVFVLVLGIWALMDGIILLIMAFRGGGWAAGILGALAIILGLILIGDYGKLGSGIAMLWAAAFWGVIGGIVMIVQAFRQRSAAKAAPMTAGAKA